MDTSFVHFTHYFASFAKKTLALSSSKRFILSDVGFNAHQTSTRVSYTKQLRLDVKRTKENEALRCQHLTFAARLTIKGTETSAKTHVHSNETISSQLYSVSHTNHLMSIHFFNFFATYIFFLCTYKISLNSKKIHQFCILKIDYNFFFMFILNLYHKKTKSPLHAEWGFTSNILLI